MVWTERRLNGHFAVELTGPRLTPDQPQSVRDAVYAAAIREGVVVVRDQDLTDDEFEAFAATLGKVLSYGEIGAKIGRAHV